MISRTEGKQDLWAKLSASLPTSAIDWRQDGKAVQRDGKYVARFVAYINANTVRERLDTVVPGEWDLTLELLPVAPDAATDEGEPAVSFKARLQILGVIREDVGTGRDYKSAATDAFKRAAVRFGIAHELYDYDQNWVQVDGDGRYAKPVQEPGQVYAARQARKGSATSETRPRDDSLRSGSRTADTAAAAPPAQRAAPQPAPQPEQPEAPLALDEPSCPTCGGRMWDNRLSKRNPKAPDFKCRNRACEGAIWPAKAGERRVAAAQAAADDEFPPALEDGDDDLPF